ncbi:MAG: hypothetical protein ACT6RF_09125 [Allorhizobium sp.]|uniref:hypothetical protein n=1 Tax=Allorhizobium sp. TaxID=633478 RepID=UPI0040335FD3
MDGTQLIMEQLRMMNSRLEKIDEAGSKRGRDLWVKLNEQDKALAVLDHRMSGLEGAVNGQAVTLAEYQKMKQKAEGAGWLGRKLWISGSVILTVAGSIYTGWTTIASALKWLIGKVP